MDPNDIYSLAQSAGVIDPNSGQMTAATPSYEDYLNSSVPPSDFTDEDVMAHFVPQDEPAILNEGPQLTPPAPPGLSDLASPAAPLTPGSRVGGSASHSGYSEATNKKIRKGPGAALQGEIAGIQEEGEAKQAAESQPYIGAAQKESQAAHDEALATAKYATAEGHQKAFLAKTAQDFDTESLRITTEGQAKAAETKANYLAALNDVRASKIQPGQLWGNMSGFDQAGTLAAAFVHDFLGARGIHTSAMDTLNKAVDRNIDGQIKNLQNKQTVAEGFKTLWDMQMRESGSVDEARTRMRGFMLDSMKVAIEANMSQFTAALATAKGRAAVAKIDTELAKNIAEVSKHIDNYTATRINQAIQVYGDNLRASMESARIAADKQIAADRLKADKGTFDPYAGLIPDTSDSGGGFMKWEFNSDARPEERQKFREKSADIANLTKLSREYQSLNRRFHNQGAAGGTRWSSTDTARLRSIANEIVNLRSLALTGKASNPDEAKRIAASTPQALFGGSLDIAPVIAQTENHMRQEVNELRARVAHDLAPNDPRRQLHGASGTEGEAETKEAAAIAEGADKKKTSEQLIKEGYVKDLEEHSAYEPVEEVGADVKADHDRFVATHPGSRVADVPKGKAKVFYPDGERIVDASEAEAAKKKGYVVREGSEAKTPPVKFERTLTRLKVGAQKAKEMMDSGTTPEEKAQGKAVYDEYVGLLRHVASGLQTNPDDDEGQYAVQMLGDMGEDAGIATEEHPDLGDYNVSHIELPPIPESAKRK